MQVKLAGQSKNVETEVEDLNHLAEDGKIQVTAGMPEGQGRLGDLVSFTANIESGIYPCVIPIEALREDNEGYYCLAAEPEKDDTGRGTKGSEDPGGCTGKEQFCRCCVRSCDKGNEADYRIRQTSE